MPKRVLITGGAGFVGKYFCKHLLGCGYSVTCIDNLMSESSSAPNAWPVSLRCVEDPNFEFIQQDCREYFKDAEHLNTQYEIIMHLAAVVGGRVHMENSPLEVSEDLSIDAAFFNWLTKLTNKPGKVVYFSSSAVYPVQLQEYDNHQLLDESLLDFPAGHIGLPDVTYGWAKMTGEYLASVAHAKYGINIVCYRPFSGYSETQNEVYPFIGILKRVLNSESPIEIWSDSVRDFVHLEDVVACVLHTMHQVSDGRAINIGTGRAVSFSELARMMMQCANHHADVSVVDNKPKGVYYRVANTFALNDVYGWTPSITIEDGISRAVTYLQNQV
jgi:nucleoside-diphosphate-sugar epimerase